MKDDLRAQIAEYFDEGFYAMTGEARKMRVSPIDHYVKIGEARGIPPSKRFDPTFYREAYDDLRAYPDSLLHHYVRVGKRQGRFPVSFLSSIRLPAVKAQPTLTTVVVLVHEATRSDTSILALNLISQLSRQHNVVTLLMKGGPTEAALADASSVLLRLPDNLPYRGDEVTQLFRKIIATYRPAYAVANTTLTADPAILLEELGVPVVALVHELPDDHSPVADLRRFYKTASRIVFPAETVADAYKPHSGALRSRDYLVTPHSAVKAPSAATASDVSGSRAKREIRSRIAPEAFVVAGQGAITYRNGVDVFVSVAAEIMRRRPRRNIQFVWIGHASPSDASYKFSIDQQIDKSGLAGRVVVLTGANVDPLPVYRRSDAFFLASRLDALPVPAVEAALRGLPVLSFENASGISEIFEADRSTRSLVVPHLDISAAARTILRIATDTKFATSMSQATRKKAREAFSLTRYARTIERIGQSCIDDRAQSVHDMQTIAAAGVFDTPFCLSIDGEGTLPPQEGLQQYLAKSRSARPYDRAHAGLVFRRPMVGFNPLIYASDHPELRASHEDPLAHFLRAGSPPGRWTHQVIRADQPHRRNARRQLRVALHGHFYYPELVEDFLQRLSGNTWPIDLKITTSDPKRETSIKRTLSKFGVRNAEVRVVPNRGRDIGPFLGLFRRGAAAYDVIGHLHGKRTEHIEPVVADRWRDFAFEHLLGGLTPVADIILDRFADDPTLGLVFPEDPTLHGWDGNRATADALAKQMKLRQPLPRHFDFPVGNMFWARPQAIKPIFDLNLSTKILPAEPVPPDGTILHTLERMWPFAAESAGFRYATIHVPGSSR